MKTVGKLLNWTLALSCVSAFAVDAPPSALNAASAPQGMSSPRVDNTSINQRDKGAATLTPQNQPNRAQDRKALAAVRRAIVSDKSLSSMAHNVKIVVDGGVVTLRGPVKSEDERAKVESLAKQVSGIMSTDNQLDVKTDVSSK